LEKINSFDKGSLLLWKRTENRFTGKCNEITRNETFAENIKSSLPVSRKRAYLYAVDFSTARQK